MGSCYNKIEINVPISTVWGTISDFHNMSWAAGVITECRKVGEKSGAEPGAKRVLNEAFHETLLKIDTDAFTFSYSIDDGPGPVSSSAVSDYVGLVKLAESNGGTLVEWSSSYVSDHDTEVVDFCDPIYRALLAALKDTLEP